MLFLQSKQEKVQAPHVCEMNNSFASLTHTLILPNQQQYYRLLLELRPHKLPLLDDGLFGAGELGADPFAADPEKRQKPYLPIGDPGQVPPREPRLRCFGLGDAKPKELDADDESAEMRVAWDEWHKRAESDIQDLCFLREDSLQRAKL